ncbi:soluble calcium-activated nucleotidase 1 [Eurytemora carolleeae]|uniref:soluble calcium-activated nucleotidase 1 n=1 Tax=Eurytemora carolleeae TaxID=1294199 RepID=UPI000C75FE22|nr:soluble calcium-activated nucleotidase 1 [Eurytemora carolleeae]|eukprot:XP_023343490.1 soluble calcium-activated nucleotidase 1-like [Eurytemora affinis]
MMSRSKSASSLVNMEGATGWDWRSNTPPGGRDWRAAISTPLAYRIGNSTVHFRPHLILVSSIIIVAIILLFYSSFGGRKRSIHVLRDNLEHDHLHTELNTRYPLSDILYSGDTKIYKIAIISDLDTDSAAGDNKWKSYLRYGELRIKMDYSRVEVNTRLILYSITLCRYGELRIKMDYSRVEVNIPEKSLELFSNLGAGGRGMELSELSVYNGKLYSLDDRTGVVYQIQDGGVIPWLILSDGPGNQTKAFKSEWSTVKGDDLWVGGLGKEWTTQDGKVLNTHPMFVKKINRKGEVEHIDWTDNYLALRETLGILPPGYMIHEAVSWSPALERWVFLPRRASKERYDDVEDERRGTNLMILADENFQHIESRTVGEIVPTHGFSSFKFLPGSNDEIIIALKSEEFEGKISSYVMVFNIQGKILLPEQKIADKKFEGIEFV